MALEYFDGFDDYSTAQLSRWWNGVGSNAAIGATGRNGTNGYRATTVNGWIAKTPGAVATRTVGFGFKFSALPSSLPLCFLCFYDSAAGAAQVTLCLTSGGLVQARRGNIGGTILSTSAVSLVTATWVFIEVTVTISATVGVVTVAVNGVAVLTLTGQNTKNSANTTTDAVILNSDQFSSEGSSMPSVATVDIDDFYSRSDATMLGDCRVETIFATGAGASTQWTPLSAANWQNVSHNPATDDTNYNSDANAGDIDTYGFGSISSTAGTVIAVMACPVLRNDSAGSVTAAPVYRSGGTNYFGTTVTIGSSSYATYPDIQVNDPNTSAPWAVAAVNSCQYGIKRVT